MANVVCYNTPLYFQYSATCEGNEREENTECQQKKERLKKFLIEEMNMLILDSQYNYLVEKLNQYNPVQYKVLLNKERLTYKDLTDQQRALLSNCQKFFFIKNCIEEKVEKLKEILQYKKDKEFNEKLVNECSEAKEKIKTYTAPEKIYVEAEEKNIKDVEQNKLEAYFQIPGQTTDVFTKIDNIVSNYKKLKIFIKNKQEIYTKFKNITLPIFYEKPINGYQKEIDNLQVTSKINQTVNKEYDKIIEDKPEFIQYCNEVNNEANNEANNQIDNYKLVRLYLKYNNQKNNSGDVDIDEKAKKIIDVVDYNRVGYPRLGFD